MELELEPPFLCMHGTRLGSELVISWHHRAALVSDNNVRAPKHGLGELQVRGGLQQNRSSTELHLSCELRGSLAIAKVKAGARSKCSRFW